MAESRLEEIFGKSVNSAKELRQGIIDLQNSVKDLGTNEESLKKGTEDLVYAQEEYNKMVNSAKQATDFASDSILGMEKQYKNLYNTYKMLTEEQRESDFGKNMAESLNSLSEKLNESKQEVGNYKDNIGHYTQSIMDAFDKMGIAAKTMNSPMKAASAGVKSLSAAMKTLIANPVGAIIMAIVVAFKALVAIVKKAKDAINKNEESQMKLREAMAAFQPVLDTITNMWDKLGQMLVKVIGWAGQAVTAVRRFFSSDKESFDEQQKVYSDLAKSQNELIKKKREYSKLNSQDKANLESLKEQAAAMENGAEKTAILTQAKELQEQITQRNIELAEIELANLKTEASLTANSAEMNDKLAAAETKVNQARAEGAAALKELAGQLKESSKASTSFTSSIDKQKEKAKELYEELIENSKTELQKENESYEKKKALLDKYIKDKEQHNKAIQQLEKEHNEKIESISDAEAEKIAAKNKANYSAIAQSMRDVSTTYATKEIKTDADNRERDFIKFDKALTKAAEDLGRKSEEYEKVQQSLWDKINEYYGEFLDDKVTDLQTFDTAYRKIISDAIKANNDYYAALAQKKTNESEEDYLNTLAFNPYKGQENTYEYYKYVADAEDALLEEKKAIKQEEVANFRGAEEEKIAKLNEVTELELECIDRKQQREAEFNELRKQWDDLARERNLNLIADTQNALGGLSSLISGYQTLTKAQKDNNSNDEKQKKKQMQRLKTLQKLEAAVAATSVIVNTASGIMGVWRAYAQEKIANAETAAATGPAAAGTLAALNAKSLISAILQTAGLAATGMGQLASVRGNYISGMSELNESSDASSTSTATATPIATIDSTPYSYTRTLQTEEEEEALNRPIYVSVTDINEVQNKVKVRDEESTY